MNMRTVHDRSVGQGDPYSDYPNGNATLVDKMLGTAYDVVKYVARHIRMLEYVASNMETIHAVAENIKTNGLVLGVTLEAGQTASIAIPEGVVPGQILSSSVLIEAPSGNLYGSDSGYFTATIQEGALRLHLNSDAPSILENAVVRWFLTYGV